MISSCTRDLIRNFFPHINLRIIFKNDFTIKSFFPFKDKTPFNLRSNVVYKYTCASCLATYYGETSRHMQTRIAEHRGLSPRTGACLTRANNSRILDHALNTGHDIRPDNFAIVYSTGKFDLCIAESILIQKDKPNLNSMFSSVPLLIHD